VERGKAVSPPYAMYGRQTVRHAFGAAVLRMWKKRMPFCNEMKIKSETGLNWKLEIFGFQEVGADFHEVFCCERI
jgi:hypothetical protein